jgi:hypothetical protein
VFNVGLYPDDAREHGVVLDVSVDEFLAVSGEGCFAVNLPIVLQVGYVSSRQGSNGAGTPKEQRICTTGTASGNSYFLTT